MTTNIFKLNEEVAPKEILKYFETKYKTENIVSSRTIYNWLKELNIECIQPKPSKNSDIRYRKSDVLKLEKYKENDLQKFQHRDTAKKELEKKAQLTRKKLEEYYSQLSYEGMEEDSVDSYMGSAERIIKEDMLEMCFEELFPNIVFDTKELAKKLVIRDLMTTMNFSDEEIGSAIDYIEKKLYIKGKR